MTKAKNLLSLLEGNIYLDWIISGVKVVSMSLSGSELTLYTNSRESLKDNEGFLKEFKQRLFQRGIEGSMKPLKDKPAKVLGATDRVNRIVGSRLVGPAYVTGSVMYKVDDNMKQGIKDWHK